MFKLTSTNIIPEFSSALSHISDTFGENGPNSFIQSLYTKRVYAMDTRVNLNLQAFGAAGVWASCASEVGRYTKMILNDGK